MTFFSQDFCMLSLPSLIYCFLALGTLLIEVTSTDHFHVPRQTWCLGLNSFSAGKKSAGRTTQQTKVVSFKCALSLWNVASWPLIGQLHNQLHREKHIISQWLQEGETLLSLGKLFWNLIDTQTLLHYLIHRIFNKLFISSTIRIC